MSQTFTQYGRALALATMLASPLGAVAQTGSPLAQALEQLNARRARFGLSEADLRDPAVTDQYTDAHNGVTHVYLRQRHQGIEIYGAVADLHLDRNGRMASAHSSFITNAAALARTATPALSAEQAVAAAARALQMPAPQGLQLVQEGAPAAGMVFSKAGISLENIPAKLMYFRLPSGELALTWNVTIYPLDGQHYWDARVDATTGQLLDRTDFVVGEEASFAALSQRRPAAPATTMATPAGTTPAARPNVPNTYHVLPLTIESPSHGARAQVTAPANALASPFGWHDTDGVAGAEFTTTRGNNVDAYEDRNNANAPGFSPDGGANLEFDFPYLPTATTRGNQNAAITNLFYWNNLVHDVMDRHGFTEVAGNFQVRNYSGQGRGADQVQAEAQDGSGFNNANFGTPPDGTRPRMQMYLWNQPGAAPLRVTAPASAAGNYTVGEAGWGAALEDAGLINDTVVVVNSTTGCTALTNASQVRGNIALIRRGGCTFKTKALMAQQAGARMVIITDTVVAAAPIAMGDDATITTPIIIPVVSVTKATGDRLRTAFPGDLLATASVVRRDGDFDNGIIAHEYGHGISNRLTGGPANSNCLGSREQMGEGWSDFFGLWLTTKPGDVGSTPRGVGTFAQFQNTNGRGIRQRMYSTDMLVNELTYGSIGAPYTAVHDIGTVWATVLWDLNWALIGRHGYNTDMYGNTGGNNIALKLVLDGCKLQPCNPGFIDGRNAILKADSLNNGAANSALIWQVFARRGMGASAVQGSSNVLTDQTVAFDLPAVLSTKAKLSEQSMAVFPNPASDLVTVRLFAGSKTPVLVEVVNNLGQVVQRTTAAAALLQREGVELSTAGLPAGLYVVRLTGSTGTVSQKLLVRH